ncbi:MAG: aldolase/citrate lyase family protein [Pirellulaceae bacterium]|jgi:2-keto-3-deoxy-L-rhamnonate aldolase RhmA/quercetin dioxygenase-like cupin family protein|nr:aldolase/citrate lyase family protein [Pirellulaceae bacterium]MDP7018913.1 aldolase/citrate lyase family protein [Pirellulaceae bacterium]
MKTKALKRFRAKLADNEPLYGLWVTLESASITEMAVALGIDWIVVDAEHGHLDWKEINEHIRAGLRSDTVVLVRLAERSTSLTKRALDIGADGVVIPWVETAGELEEAIRDCRYPTEGRRGIGGERATAWGQCLAEHTSVANEHVLVVPLIESVAAIPNIPAMCSVDGADVFFFGPADFSSTAGYRGQWEGPGVAEQILELKDSICEAGKHCGLVTTSIGNLVERREQGFRMLGVGADNGLLLRSIHQALQAVDRDRMPAPSLDPADGRDVRLPLARPPEHMTPDRDEIITRLGDGESVELEPGVVMEALVGGFNTARGLTTAIVTMQPESRLNYHTHPCGESVTVLDGQAEVSVAGRTYRLGPLDNITIPRWLPHQTHNPDPSSPVRLHVALAMSVPERESVSRAFDRAEMPPDSSGAAAGGERVTRFSLAERQRGVGSGVEYIDYFNASLVAGIEMSGGFARFETGGRLPNHVHDFDESICIVRGSANCLVEGRQALLGDCATAMVPRGRVHYFINDSADEMEMIWVYAGPTPERIVIAPGFSRDLSSPAS